MKRTAGVLILFAFFAGLWFISVKEHTLESVVVFGAALGISCVIAGLVALAVKWIVEN
jgi:hypothetical protein